MPPCMCRKGLVVLKQKKITPGLLEVKKSERGRVPSPLPSSLFGQTCIVNLCHAAGCRVNHQTFLHNKIMGTASVSTGVATFLYHLL